MEFRFSTFIKALLLFACALGGCDYMTRLDKLKTELAELKAQALTVRDAVDSRSQEWKEIKAARDKLNQLLKHEEELLQQRDRLDIQERRLAGEIKYLTGSMGPLVEKARSSAIGTVLPELRLPGRPFLQNAKIFRITDDSITFLHEDGAANLHVKADELPPEFVRKYDLGAASISKGLQRLWGELAPPQPGN